MRFTPRPDCQIAGLADYYEKYLPETGFFVEVGAFDGATVSNTVFLAEAGWSGVYIEPHPQEAANCARNHREHLGITVVQAAVSDYSGEGVLYEVGECSSLVWDQSTIDWGGSKDRSIKVCVTTLEEILKEALCQPEFDLLVVDVEQNELNVLLPFDLGKWKPRMAIVEAHEKDPAEVRNKKAGPINEYFSRFGYTKIHADHINSIFIRPWSA